MYTRSLSIILLISFSMVFTISEGSAQETNCPEMVLDAYNLTQEVCSEMGNDEACYGNLSVAVEPDNLTFQAPGDLADVVEIESLQLSSMNEADGEWGISLMQLAVLASQVDNPQTIELVLFGNVQIQNAGGEDGEYSPMQAFTFQTGVDDRPCDEAPDSGIMIQTPEGVGEITLLINEVTIELGSTAFLQAEAGNEMLINIVEGQADVSAQGTTITVPAGALARVPLDANGLADGAPEGPEPYDETALQTLPILLLTDQVAIATASEDHIEGANQDVVTGNGLAPISGTWGYESCNDGYSGEMVIETVSENEMTIGVTRDDGREFHDGYSRTETGEYLLTTRDGRALMSSEKYLDFQLVSEDRMEANYYGDVISGGVKQRRDCLLTFTR